ncbi:hypothetical protein B9Z55_017489 [Caenorhabditis nigoni]|uniref:ShKT domain-containing protein n=1 Tax=Caenorhabditis nigoni TaxID=1611254 RepID=A0A2G5TA95_9PELO|nr:hypothetical protein B9Z55_017489 [Caenorhabditis nigoni]
MKYFIFLVFSIFSTTVCSELCVDNFMVCDEYKAQCDEVYYQRNCALTCGVCTPDPNQCYDFNTDCPRYKDACNDSRFLSICPKTCGNCETTVPPRTTKTTKKPTPTTPKPPCKDASPNCRAWAKDGFCHNKFYPLEKRKENCAKTCKLC